MLFNFSRQFDVFGYLCGLEQGTEFFLIEVMKNDFVSVCFYRVNHRFSNGVIETFGVRMGKNDGN